MRRATLALIGTALGTTLMVGAKLGTRPAGGSVDLGQSEAMADPGAPDASGSPVASALASATAVPGQSSPPGAATPGAPGAPGGPTAPSTTRPPATTPAPGGSGLKNGTFPGTAVTEKYGTIKVTIVVSGGRITDATATYPTGGETGDINARAIPRLRQEVLAAQGASIAVVSGATYTSNAYKQSLQAAINAAKA